MTPAEILTRLDRAGALTLAADGPYVRYGFPCSIHIERDGDVYRTTCWDHGDGSTAIPPVRRIHDRESLRAYVDQLLTDDRPVRVTE